MFTAKLKLFTVLALVVTLAGSGLGLLMYQSQAAPASISPEDEPPKRPLDVHPKPIGSDKTVKYDYDIVYVRAPRFVKASDGKERPSAWPEIGHPYNISPGYDLMLLHPDGSEELLVKGGEGSVTDPYVSFDAQWVYY